MGPSRVGVIGCGTMGHGIVQVTAQAGLAVVAVEQDEVALAGALGRIEKAVGRLEEKGRIDSAAAVQDRVTGTTDVDSVLAPGAVCATNTSSLSVIGQAMATGRPDRFIGLHFFNPVPVMSLLEVIRSIASSDEAVAVGEAYGRQIGKDVVSGPDRAGFVVNRLLLPYCMDAIRAFESGVGSIADIDMAMHAGCGYPMGPFTLLDFVGLDTVFTMTKVMYEEYAETRFAAPPTLRKLIEAGFLGRKSGRGFYDYAFDPPVPAVGA
jgi:3-hydroxybutyryl-CoA dehydrogenase